MGCPAVLVRGGQVTVVARDRPGLLWRASGVLAAHRLTVRAATAAAHGPTAGAPRRKASMKSSASRCAVSMGLSTGTGAGSVTNGGEPSA